MPDASGRTSEQLRLQLIQENERVRALQDKLAACQQRCAAMEEKHAAEQQLLRRENEVCSTVSVHVAMMHYPIGLLVSDIEMHGIAL